MRLQKRKRTYKNSIEFFKEVTDKNLTNVYIELNDTMANNFSLVTQDTLLAHVFELFDNQNRKFEFLTDSDYAFIRIKALFLLGTEINKRFKILIKNNLPNTITKQTKKQNKKVLRNN